MVEQMTLFGQDTWSGKTSPEPFQATAEKTSRQSSKKRSGSSSRKPPLFLYLKKDGPQADASWVTHGALLGEFSMHSFGESPSVAVESHLSQILEDTTHPKYALPAKACQGILNRANRRGKKLPEVLEDALRNQACFQPKSIMEENWQRSDVKNAIRAEESKTTHAILQPVAYGIDQQGGKGGANYAVDVMPTICGDSHGTPHAVAYSVENHPADSRVDIDPTGKGLNLTSRMGTGGGNVPMVMSIGNGQTNQSYTEGIVGALNCMHDQQAVFCQDIAHALKAKANLDFREDSETYVVSGLDCRNGKENGDLCGTPQSKPNGGFSLNCIHPVRVNHTVRRLTPLECERLQGYPDGWTDIGEWVDSKGKLHKSADSPRYKALGNSIAIPPWKWLLKRLCACYERDATMASLFDGIGGFPYIWEQLNGKGSCLWASEIEEFPMAVTKVRFQ